jgi:autotransporter-associated beta strand protein
VAPTHILKIGDGTLTLSGANTYTGDTLVQDGVLRFTSNTLSSMGDVSLYTGGVLNLDTSSAQSTIDQLFLDGVGKLPGIYGAVGSGAKFETPLITGSGTLVVIGYRLPGDFDGNTFVDDADLALWRARANNADGGDLDADANGDNNTDGTDFLLWQRHYGQSFPVTGAASAVPEPAAASLAGLALASLAAARRRRSR